jgi:predicted nuclease of predicted toxin-antitoxin system
MKLSPHWLDRLTAAGLSAVHWSTVGRVDAPDTEIMAYAATHDYIVMTHDLDFGAVLASTRVALGFMCCRCAHENGESARSNIPSSTRSLPIPFKARYYTIL